MQMVGMIAFIALMVIAIGLFVKIAINARSIVKTKITYLDYRTEMKQFIVLNIASTLCFTLAIGAIYFWANITPKWYEPVVGLLCSSIFIFSLITLYISFRLHYYKASLPKTLDKVLYILMMSSIPAMIISLWYSFNGFTAYFTYPIANGINIPNGVSTPIHSFTNGLTISFYAICILSGAIFVYLLSDHKMYQQYGKHGTIESTFLVAFPAGIIGARIWYVVGNWKVDGFDKDFWSVFKIWNGGLTILGGAIMGIVVGVLWFMWRNKHLSIWVAVDMIVPTILLAQAIGRIGNFFNCEVHGNPVPMSSWNWLPQIIVQNGQFTSADGLPNLTDGTFYLPLFLIEGVLNVLGYFLISGVFGKYLRKYTELGDLAFGYVLVYGLIRMPLEPLRVSSFNMGENGYWSWIFSSLFVVFGALGIFVNHLVRFIIRNKRNNTKTMQNGRKNSLIALIVLGVVTLGLLAGAIVLMAGGKPNFTSLVYDRFNIGVMLLVLMGGALLFALTAGVRFFEELKYQGASDGE